MSDGSTLPLSQGMTLGGYRIEKVLGQGGFGLTYLATHEEKAGTFAVKEYFPSGAAQRSGANTVTHLGSKKRFFDVGLKDFFDEAMLMTTLPTFPGLVRVVAALKKFGTAYCVMEFIDGETMDHIMPLMVRSYGHFPEDRILSALENILSALSIVHAQDLIHRDIKLSNLMIDRDGVAWLIDFGAARNLALPRKAHSSFTETYAPIEQFPNAKLEEGPQTDFFSLGVTLYILIAQTSPATARERKALVDDGQSDPYVALAAQPELSMKYSTRLLKMVDRCCALHISDRPSSASEIARELKLSLTSASVMPAPEPMTAAMSKISLPSDQMMDKVMQGFFGLSKVKTLPMGRAGRKPNPLLFSLFLIALAALVTLIAYYVLDYKGVLS
ncbi:serine/threonine protein kinase [Nereida sp. NH-UV-3]|uniref:serine/threonine protein kinase n=1 Tax=Nereida TaxID=282198 RepID=UPI0036F1FA27